MKPREKKPLTEDEIKEIPELPEEFLVPEEEEVPSLADLVKRGIREMEKAKEAAKLIKEKGETRVETVAENIGVTSKQVERAKKETGFEEGAGKIVKGIKDLVLETQERIQKTLGKRPETPFNPEEEYKKVKEITESDVNVKKKRHALREYKKELVAQKEGVAQLQDSLRKAMENNPEISAEEMGQIVESRAIKLRLTDEQKISLKNLAETLNKRHETIKSVREKYPDDKEFFKACFGYEPKGKISVKEMPISLLFRCEDTDDYINTRKKVVELRGGRMSKEVAEELNIEDGVALTYSGIPELRGMLILENLPRITSQAAFEKHEEQHHFYRLIGHERMRNNIFAETTREKHEQVKQEEVESYLRYYREGLLEHKGVKDEILAFYKEGIDSLNIFLLFTRRGGDYDFYNQNQENLDDALKRLKIDPEKLQSIKEKIFRTEYDKIIKKAIDSLDILKSTGKTREEITELLVDKPLEQWPNFVRHMDQVRRGR